MTKFGVFGGIITELFEFGVIGTTDGIGPRVAILVARGDRPPESSKEEEIVGLESEGERRVEIDDSLSEEREFVGLEGERRVEEAEKSGERLSLLVKGVKAQRRRNIARNVTSRVR
jgi:hypothetical protein